MEVGKKKEGVLYIGIDRGTSRTSVAASNGTRETVWSYGGYPRDFVARKRLGKDVLFGKEAVDAHLEIVFFLLDQVGQEILGERDF